MRGAVAFCLSVLMLFTSAVVLWVAAQTNMRLGITLYGEWLDLGPLVIVVSILQLLFWALASVLGFVYCVTTQSTGTSVRQTTEQTMMRAAEAIKDMILDIGGRPEDALSSDNPELGADPLPPLIPRDFVLSMREKVDQTLARLADAINTAQTGQEIAASEEQVKTLLGELRFDALAIALQLRTDAAEREFAAMGAAPARGVPVALNTKSGKAKTYAASDYWRPVWVERYRSMRAEDTAFRLATRSRLRSGEAN
jgi:hypothetical protein